MTTEPTRRPDDSSLELVPLLDRAVGDSVNAVDGRALHFSSIAQLGLVEGVDYERFTVPQNGGAEGNRGVRHEYVIGLDPAKHVAMLEKSAAGHRVRTYFIACEKRLRAAVAAPAQPNLRDPAQAAALLVQSLELLQEEQAKRLAAETKVEEQRAELAVAGPKADAYERLTYARGAMCISNAAKTLSLPPKELFDLLAQRRWIFRRGKTWVAYEARLAQGYLVHRVWEGTRDDGTDIARERVLVTPAGLARLAVILGREVAA
jgi:phage antirepressor YoqD-like protein/phage anti-repressor protein